MHTIEFRLCWNVFFKRKIWIQYNWFLISLARNMQIHQSEMYTRRREVSTIEKLWTGAALMSPYSLKPSVCPYISQASTSKEKLYWNHQTYIRKFANRRGTNSLIFKLCISSIQNTTFLSAFKNLQSCGKGGGSCIIFFICSWITR